LVLGGASSTSPHLRLSCILQDRTAFTIQRLNNFFPVKSEHRRTPANIGGHKRTFSHSAALSEFMSFGSSWWPRAAPPSAFWLPRWPRAAPAFGRSPIRVYPVIRGRNFGFPVPGAFHRPLRVYELRLTAFIASITAR